MFLTGCVSHPFKRMHMGSDFIEKAVDEPLLNFYKTNSIILRGKNLSPEDRNPIVKDLIGLIDAEFNADWQAHHWGRAHADFWSDIMVLGVNSAAAATGGESVKTILALTSAGIVGTRLAFTKEFFREKTTEALVAKMQARRADKKREIFAKLQLTTREYDLPEAMIDIREYFQRGTIVDALVALSADAQASQKLAEEKLRESREAEQNNPRTWVVNLYRELLLLPESQDEVFEKVARAIGGDFLASFEKSKMNSPKGDVAFLSALSTVSSNDTYVKIGNALDIVIRSSRK
jgi:hypothetical protein